MRGVDEDVAFLGHDRGRHDEKRRGHAGEPFVTRVQRHFFFRLRAAAANRAGSRHQRHAPAVACASGLDRGARRGTPAGTPTGRVENANAAARVEPRREGYYNAIQIYPWSEGALYQVYAAVGQITTIALEPGESLTGAGPIAAGDTARWVIGDTESGSGANRRVHILVKPTWPDISTNLVVTTDRRTYMIELRAREALYMPAVAWAYPAPPAGQRQTVPAAPVIATAAARNYRYALRVQGDSRPWRPVSVFDDGRRVYVVFPAGIVQGEMPPIFVLGSDGEPQIVNSRPCKTAGTRVGA